MGMVVLAGWGEGRGVLASLFRDLHPRGEPRPTAGLAAQLMCSTAQERLALRDILTTGAAVRCGAIIVADDAPFFERSVFPGDSLWPALAGIDVWPSGVKRLDVGDSLGAYADW